LLFAGSYARTFVRSYVRIVQLGRSQGAGWPQAATRSNVHKKRPLLLRYYEIQNFFSLSFGQPRRLCAGANHPPLTHRSCCSPSAQASSLSCSDALIMQPLIWLASGVILVNFRPQCESAQFWDPWVPKLEPSEASHTRKAEVTPSPSVHAQNSIFTLKSCSATLYNAFSRLSLGLYAPKYLALLLSES
jgi:hypothetical protein